MNLLLFGGTFDPPHNGHMSILRNAIHAVQPDRVLVMPAGLPPHKRASGTSAALRLAMCKCFLPLFPGLEISTMELYREGKSYTWDTVQQLMAEMPGVAISLCIGSDMLLTFTEWYRWQDLLAAVTLVAQSRAQQDTRPAQQAAEALRQQGGRVVFASGEVEDISSTEVRRAVAAGQDISALVPPLVAQVIQREGLYKIAPGGDAP